MTTETSPREAREDARTQGRKKRSWKRVVAYGALGIFALILLVATSGAVFLHRSLKTGGYLEEWREGVDGETLLDVSYGAESCEKLDVYVPRENAPEKARGAILFIHGGAWVAGTRDEQKGFAKWAAKSGWLVGNMEYKLYSEEDKDGYTIEVVLDEIDAAVRKLKEIGETRGRTPQRVAISGHSAGGHLAALYAYSRGKNAEIPVAFVAPRVAPIDFHADAWTPNVKPDQIAAIVSAMTGETIDGKELESGAPESEALIARASPVSFVDSSAVPTLAAYGAKDFVVGIAHAEKLKNAFAALDARGIEDASSDDEARPVFDLLVFPKSSHMLGRDPEYVKRWRELFLAYADRYLTTDVDQSSPLETSTETR